MQLVAYGEEDIHLTGNPEMTFLLLVYRRHTNFSVESVLQTFSGNVAFSNRLSCTISRSGDLVNRIYLQVSLGALDILDKYNDWVGHCLVKSVELEIGGQRIDKHYGDWLHIWNELTLSEGHYQGYKAMISGVNPQMAPPKLKTENLPQTMTEEAKIVAASLNNSTSYVQLKRGYEVIEEIVNDKIVIYIKFKGIDDVGKNATLAGNEARTLYIPLEFWFCRNPGLALPLIALQYHEVKVHINFADVTEVATNATDPTIPLVHTPEISAGLYVDYIYLDTDERRRFAQSSHEYLIEQVQFTGNETAQSSIELEFNHPVKEIFWVEKEQHNTKVGEYISTYDTAVLQLDGQERFSARKAPYFQLVQPYQHHERVPVRKNLDENVGRCSRINVYSFAMKPEDYQPSGTCNMSRIDNAVLKMKDIQTNGNIVKIFATNYNVFRVMSGMGGLAYAN